MPAPIPPERQSLQGEKRSSNSRHVRKMGSLDKASNHESSDDEPVKRSSEQSSSSKRSSKSRRSKSIDRAHDHSQDPVKRSSSGSSARPSMECQESTVRPPSTDNVSDPTSANEKANDPDEPKKRSSEGSERPSREGQKRSSRSSRTSEDAKKRSSRSRSSDPTGKEGRKRSSRSSSRPVRRMNSKEKTETNPEGPEEAPKKRSSSSRPVRRMNSKDKNSCSEKKRSSDSKKSSRSRSSERHHTEGKVRSARSSSRTTPRVQKTECETEEENAKTSGWGSFVTNILDDVNQEPSKPSQTTSSEQDNDTPEEPKKGSSRSQSIERPSKAGQDKRSSPSSSSNLRRMNSIETEEESANEAQQETAKPAERPSLSRVPGSTRTMRRMTSSLEKTGDDIGLGSRSSHVRRSSIDMETMEDPQGVNTKRGGAKSMHNRRSSIDNCEADPLEGPAKQSGAKSMHNRRSSIEHNGKTEADPLEGPATEGRSKSVHNRRTSVNHTEVEPATPERRSKRVSKSTHRRSFEGAADPGIEKRSSRGSKSMHKRSIDHRSGHGKEGTTEKRTTRSSKSSHRRSVENSSELSPKKPSTRTKGLLRRSKSVDGCDDAIQRARSKHRRTISMAEPKVSPCRTKSTHRRSISTTKPEEPAVRARSMHRRSIGMAKPEESPRRAPRSFHIRSIGMAKPDESPCRASRSTHRRSSMGKDAVKNERIPRSRRTSVSDAKKSLLDMHLNSTNHRPRSKSPTGRKSDLRSKFVRSNSCDSRRSTLEEDQKIAKSKLLEPLPPIQRKLSDQPKLQRNGTIERRQTLALLNAQDLAKPELENSHKQRLADLGKQYKSSTLDISKMTGKKAGVKDKLSQLPTLGHNDLKKPGSRTGAATSSTMPMAATGIKGKLGQIPTFSHTDFSLKGGMLKGARSGNLPGLATPSAASIALQPIGRKPTTSVTSQGISSLVSLKELPKIGKAATSTRHKLRRSLSVESGTDLTASVGTLSTASLSMMSSTASLSMSSAHTRNSDGPPNSNGNNNNNKSIHRHDAGAIQARAQRLKELSQSHHQTSSKQVTNVGAVCA